ncbi:hypothetical protein HJG60_010970 [Phyllostomus discolor]|uniref:Uncharacterized protein n=1 Tax=Phyllostomus discolor TaxID=89673 RepID=A0A834A7C1_9CHIR|nr:hypothetical protein HJG60_010970 [Phyllostomus discolor]
MLLNIAVNFFSSSNKVLVLSRRPEAGFFPGGKALPTPLTARGPLSAAGAGRAEVEGTLLAPGPGCMPKSRCSRNALGSALGRPGSAAPPPPAPEALAVRSEPQFPYPVSEGDSICFTDGEKA